MAYLDHYLCSFGGPLRAPEVWSMNIRFFTSDVMTASEQQGAAEAAKPIILAWGAAAGSGWSSNAQLSYVKWNRIDSEGHYQDTGVTHRTDFAPTAMGPATTIQANQIAMCVSWVTDFQRGPASKGRVFMPLPVHPPLQASGRISTANCLTSANTAAAFLNSMNNSAQVISGLPDIEASVVSGVNATKARITSVRVGDVLDTQRRRRNQLPEVYTLGTTLVTDT